MRGRVRVQKIGAPRARGQEVAAAARRPLIATPRRLSLPHSPTRHGRRKERKQITKQGRRVVSPHAATAAEIHDHNASPARRTHNETTRYDQLDRDAGRTG